MTAAREAPGAEDVMDIRAKARAIAMQCERGVGPGDLDRLTDLIVALVEAETRPGARARRLVLELPDGLIRAAER